MLFEPHQSFFVVFKEEATVGVPESRGEKNFPKRQVLLEINGPWDLSFDPSLGGPKQVTFATLEDWRQRSELGIKHYSGIAAYRNTFDLPKTVQLGGRPILLDLGVVHSMARVRLNGRNLGVAWCAPWTVDITDAVRMKDNELEIDVANLWPNRLIRDKALPPEQQVARTTFNPYRADSPLLPSGLLGPVTVKSETDMEATLR
jgi:hypothetical protein